MKYLIDGCYGDGNLGDEALLQSILRVIQKQDSVADCCVLSADPGTTARSHGVRSVLQTNPFGVSVYGAVCKGLLRAAIREIKRCDVYILGGGEVLRDDVGLRATFGILYRLILAGALGKRVVMMGVGAQAPTTMLGGWLIRRAVRSSKGILFRDEESFDLHAHNRSKNAWMRWSPDIAFTLGGTHQQREHRNTATDRPIVVGIALKGLAFKRMDAADGERLIADIASACASLVPLGRVACKAIVFSPQDLPCARALADKCTSLGLAVETIQCNDVTATLDVLANLDILFAMPLHASILALANGVPCCGISYDKKVTRLYDQAGLKSSCLEIRTVDKEQLAAIAKRCLDSGGSAAAVQGFATKARNEVEQAMSDVLRQVSL